METGEARTRIRENINNHKEFLSNRSRQQPPGGLASDEKPQQASSPLHSSANENDYETTKPPAANHSHRVEEDTELFLADELRREQSKCRILEERLRNKELFIVQLKEFQSELNLAFEKSQAELHSATLHNDELTANVQKLQRENQELRRLLHHMEQQGHQSVVFERTQRFNGRTQQQRSYSQRHLPSVPPPVSTDFVGRKLAEGLSGDLEEVCSEAKRIGKFVKYVWDLVASCCREATRHMNLRSKLKLSWRWLKDIVKESASIRDQNVHLRSERGKISKMLGTHQPLAELQRLSDENQQYLQLVRLAMDYFHLPEDCTATRLELTLKEGLKRSR